MLACLFVCVCRLVVWVGGCWLIDGLMIGGLLVGWFLGWFLGCLVC